MMAWHDALHAWWWGPGASAVVHGIEAGSGNDVIEPEMTSSVGRSGIGGEKIT